MSKKEEVLHQLKIVRGQLDGIVSMMGLLQNKVNFLSF